MMEALKDTEEECTHDPTDEDTEHKAGMIQRKKRRRCGSCEPCLKKANCGECSNCVNRKTGHQICKFRKCVELKKPNTLASERFQRARQTAHLHKAIRKKYHTKRLSTALREKLLDNNAPVETIIENVVLEKPELENANSPSLHMPNKEEIVCVEKEKAHSVLPCEEETEQMDLEPPSATTDMVEDEPPRTSPVQELGVRPESPPQTRSFIEFEPPCSCKVGKEDGPYYVHLGSASSKEALREKLESRFQLEGEALKIEQVELTTKEAKNPYGCPVARWILRRPGPWEKVLVVTRQRQGHTCEHAFLVICIVAWDAVSLDKATTIYNELSGMLPSHAVPTVRRCGTNEGKTCACQGSDPDVSGASFSFGCSWSMYYNGCKFTRSKSPRKFKLQSPSKEEHLENILQDIASHLAPLYKTLAPHSYNNQVYQEDESLECRIGQNKGRPFSGVTCCVDFCAHNHKDKHNMEGGSTTVLSILNPESASESDEQLHVLPLYCLLDKDGKRVIPGPIPEHLKTSRLQPPGSKEPTNKATSNKSAKISQQGSTDSRPPPVKTNSVPSSPSGYPGYIPGHPMFEPPYNMSGQSMPLGGYHREGYPTNGFHNGFHNPGHYYNPTRPSVIHWVDEKQIPLVYENRHPFQNKPSFEPPIRYVDDSRGIPLIRPWNIPMPQPLFNGISSPPGMGCGQDMHRYQNGFDSKPGHDVRWVDERYVPFIHRPHQASTPNSEKTNGHRSWHETKPELHNGNAHVENPTPKEEKLVNEVERKPVIQDETWITSEMGGVAIALTNGSMLLECAKKEVHATTSLKHPSRHKPTRISLVFYQHKQLNARRHGIEGWEKKVALRKLENEEAMKAEAEAAATPTESCSLEMLAETALSQSNTNSMMPPKLHSIGNHSTMNSNIYSANSSLGAQSSFNGHLSDNVQDAQLQKPKCYSHSEGAFTNADEKLIEKRINKVEPMETNSQDDSKMCNGFNHSYSHKTKQSYECDKVLNHRTDDSRDIKPPCTSSQSASTPANRGLSSIFSVSNLLKDTKSTMEKPEEHFSDERNIVNRDSREFKPEGSSSLQKNEMFQCHPLSSEGTHKLGLSRPLSPPLKQPEHSGHYSSSSNHSNTPSHHSSPSSHYTSASSHRSASSHHPSTTSHHPSAPSHHPSAPSHHPSTPSHHPSTPSHHPSAPSHHSATPSHHPSMPLHHSSAHSHHSSAHSHHSSPHSHHSSPHSHHHSLPPHHSSHHRPDHPHHFSTPIIPHPLSPHGIPKLEPSYPLSPRDIPKSEPSLPLSSPTLPKPIPDYPLLSPHISEMKIPNGLNCPPGLPVPGQLQGRELGFGPLPFPNLMTPTMNSYLLAGNTYPLSYVDSNYTQALEREEYIRSLSGLSGPCKSMISGESLMDPSLAGRIPLHLMATRAGMTCPVNSLITMSPYSQPCVTGHYQRWT